MNNSIIICTLTYIYVLNFELEPDYPFSEIIAYTRNNESRNGNIRVSPFHTAIYILSHEIRTSGYNI